jgi:ankyrin repeat protein
MIIIIAKCSNPLQLAARGTYEKFKEYLAEEPSRVGIIDQKRKSAVHHAAANGQIEILTFLFSQGGGRGEKCLRRFMAQQSVKSKQKEIFNLNIVGDACYLFRNMCVCGSFLNNKIPDKRQIRIFSGICSMVMP